MSCVFTDDGNSTGGETQSEIFVTTGSKLEVSVVTFEIEEQGSTASIVLPVLDSSVFVGLLLLPLLAQKSMIVAFLFIFYLQVPRALI